MPPKRGAEDDCIFVVGGSSGEVIGRLLDQAKGNAQASILESNCVGENGRCSGEIGRSKVGCYGKR
jgi:hypothetical protein